MEAFLWVTVVQIWANMGITMVIFLAGLQTIPDELHEAARIDGASRRQAFWHVTWPLLTPGVNDQPDPEHHRLAPGVAAVPRPHGYRPGTQVLGYVVYAQAFGQTSGSTTSNSFRQGYGAAASVVLFVARVRHRHHRAVPAAPARGAAARMNPATTADPLAAARRAARARAGGAASTSGDRRRPTPCCSCSRSSISGRC